MSFKEKYLVTQKVWMVYGCWGLGFRDSSEMLICLGPYNTLVCSKMDILYIRTTPKLYNKNTKGHENGVSLSFSCSKRKNLLAYGRAKARRRAR